MSEKRSPPKRIRVTGLQEAQILPLVELDGACAEQYHALGFDAAEVPPRSEEDIAKLPARHSVRVAEADHVVAGYLAWRDEAPGVAYIEELGVHPDHQRFGIGSRLLESMLTEARSFGLGEICALCWERASFARSFYERMGFQPVDASAPAKVLAWRDERSSGRPFPRPGQVLLWREVGRPSIAVEDEPTLQGEG